MSPHLGSPGLGIGLSLIGSLANEVDIAGGPDGTGTAVRMRFAARRGDGP
jgi:hypothetical protein